MLLYIRSEEVILIDSEKMKIVDISSNNLTVKRAWDGSVLAAHTVSTAIFTQRRLTVERGVLGTTAASHNSGADILRHSPPGLIREYCIALAEVTIQQKLSGYARIAGLRNYNLRNVNQRDAVGRGLSEVREDAYDAYGRKYRKRAV